MVINKRMNITINKLEYCHTSQDYYTLFAVVLDLVILTSCSKELMNRIWPAFLGGFEFWRVISYRDSNRPS